MSLRPFSANLTKISCLFLANTSRDNDCFKNRTFFVLKNFSIRVNFERVLALCLHFPDLKIA